MRSLKKVKHSETGSSSRSSGSNSSSVTSSEPWLEKSSQIPPRVSVAGWRVLAHVLPLQMCSLGVTGSGPTRGPGPSAARRLQRVRLCLTHRYSPLHLGEPLRLPGHHLHLHLRWEAACYRLRSTPRSQTLPTILCAPGACWCGWWWCLRRRHLARPLRGDVGGFGFARVKTNCRLFRRLRSRCGERWAREGTAVPSRSPSSALGEGGHACAIPVPFSTGRGWAALVPTRSLKQASVSQVSPLLIGLLLSAAMDVFVRLPRPCVILLVVRIDPCNAATTQK